MFVMVNSESGSGNKAIKSLSFESDSIVFFGGKYASQTGYCSSIACGCNLG